MSYDVTVIGEIYQDHVFSGFAEWPNPGEEVFTEAYTWELGGGAIITACALSKLGHKVQLIGVVGKSQFAGVKARLSDFGVSAEHLHQSDHRGGVTVSISTQQDRTFFTYRGVNAALQDLLAGNDDLLQRAADAKHVHLAFPLDASSMKSILPALRGSGATISLDVGHHVGWLKDPDSLHVLQATDYLLPNEKEAAVLCGSAEEYLRFCHSLGVKNAVVKLGSAGAAMLADGVEYRASSPDVAVLDTTGAGDAFDAGFIDGLLSSAGPQVCLELGCACGALSTKAVGALASLPTSSELQSFCEEKHVA